jgi:hypothetical protein
MSCRLGQSKLGKIHWRTHEISLEKDKKEQTLCNGDTGAVAELMQAVFAFVERRLKILSLLL